MREELKEKRRQTFAQMEQRLHESWSSEKDSMFYYHPSEDRIVLSHALFWVMTQPQCLKGKIRKEKYFLLLRQYQEEMLDAYLQDTEDFPTMLHYCNIIYEYLPMMLKATHNLRTEKMAANSPPQQLSPLALVVTCQKTWPTPSWTTWTSTNMAK